MNESLLEKKTVKTVLNYLQDFDSSIIYPLYQISNGKIIDFVQ